MEKIRPFWRIVIGFLIFCVCVYCTNMLAFGVSWFAFAFSWALFVSYVFLAVKIKYDDPLRSMRDMMQKQLEQQSGKDRAAPSGGEPKPETGLLASGGQKPAEERQAPEEPRGMFFSKIVGVTFDNEDGTSRQKILRDYYVTGVDGSDLNLEEFEYNGKPAVRVLVDDQCIGNIPKNRVDELLLIMDRLRKASLNIEVFAPDEDEDDPEERRRRGPKIYRADIFLEYAK